MLLAACWCSPAPGHPDNQNTVLLLHPQQLCITQQPCYRVRTLCAEGVTAHAQMIATWRQLITLVQQLASYNPSLVSEGPDVAINDAWNAVQKLEEVEGCQVDWEALVIKKKVRGCRCKLAGWGRVPSVQPAWL